MTPNIKTFGWMPTHSLWAKNIEQKPTWRNILISCIISSLNVMIKRFQSSYYFLLWNELKIEFYSKWKRKSVNLTVKFCCLPRECMNGIHEKKSRSINPKTDMTRNRNKKESHTHSTNFRSIIALSRQNKLPFNASYSL